jgi:hypothetical protein
MVFVGIYAPLGVRDIADLNSEVCGSPTPYQPHPERMPLRLQDHNYKVRFRNIWIRELGEAK